MSYLSRRTSEFLWLTKNVVHNKFIRFFCSFRLPHTYLLQQFEICMAFFVRQLHYVPSMKSFRSLSHWLAYNSDVRIPSACLNKKRRNIHLIMNMQFSFHLFVQQIYCKIIKLREIIATTVTCTYLTGMQSRWQISWFARRIECPVKWVGRRRCVHFAFQR